MNDHERKLLVDYHLEKAEDTYVEVKIHVKNELWNTAINRLYYGCYNAVSGLLLKNEINAQSLTGVRQMLGLHFIKSIKIPNELGKFYSNLFNMRQSGDYVDFITFEKNDVLTTLPTAEALIKKIEELVNK